MKHSTKQTSRILGILILLGVFVGIMSIVPSVESEDYLKEVYPNKNQVYFGALFQFLLVPIHIGFALILYKTIKEFNGSLSLGFIGFRFTAGAFQLMGVVLLPMFVLLSKQYLSNTDMDSLFFEANGEMLKLFRDLSNHLGVMLATGLGNLCLYFILFKGKYIPTWLSLWGVLGNGLIIVASFLLLFQVFEVVSTEYVSMTLPIVLQEMVLAIFLIIKGLSLPKSVH